MWDGVNWVEDDTEVFSQLDSLITNINSISDNKVDKVLNKSLILDSEITRLGTLVNTDISAKADKTYVDSENFLKVDKVIGSSLIDEASIIRLSNTSGINTGDNATNTQYSGLENSKQDKLIAGSNISIVGNTISSTSSGGSTANIKEIEVDFGTIQNPSYQFTINDLDVQINKIVLPFASPNQATDRVGNDWEVESATFTAKVDVGNFILSVSSDSTIVGKRKIIYQII
jgi:hypothetical protein